MCKMKQQIYLVGIGMGDKKSRTCKAEQILSECSCIIGAKRLTESVKDLKKPVYSAYKPEEIKGYIKEHPEYEKIGIVLSGDTGFYSGAKKLEEALSGYELSRVPGLSSVVYLAAALHTSWEDAALVSAHGREQNYIYAMLHQEKIFLLLGGQDCGEQLCEKIRAYGLSHLDFWIGRNLSYPDEQILHKKGGELLPGDCSNLDVAMIRNPHPDRRVSPHIEDEEFLRGKVPMTKSEIRALSLAKLALTRDAVLYDVGAGTGSIAVEAALMSEGIRVYAVEKNPEGVRMIRENKKKFGCDWLHVVEGMAPEVLKDLEPPTHVFIGGSTGNLKEIIRAVKAKNAQVHVVLTAISLETIKEALEAAQEGLLTDPEITQISAARARKLGKYHMMTGQNPVYLIAEGRE